MKALFCMVSLIAGVLLSSCNTLSTNENAAQILMGGSSEQLMEAMGSPRSIVGSYANGRMEWGTWYQTTELIRKPGRSVTRTDYDPETGSSKEVTKWIPPHDVVVTDDHHFELTAETAGNTVRALSYRGNIDFARSAWLTHNQALLTWNQACAYDDVSVVMQMAGAHALYGSGYWLMQGAAQAARYDSDEVLAYLVSAKGVDIHAPLQTWAYNAGYPNNLILVNTSIAQILQAYGSSSCINKLRAMGAQI